MGMTTCLVTGGAGFIGSHLVEGLLAQGDQVRVFDNLSSGDRENLAPVAASLEFIQADIQDEVALARALVGVEVVFHLAAMVSVPESMKKPVEAESINALGSLKLLSAARQAGVRRVVLSSTSAIYGDEPTLPKRETMPAAPLSPYAISKLTAEHYCQFFYKTFDLETVILRYFNVFGPRQDPRSFYSGVISIFIDRLARGEPPLIYGDGEQTRDFIFVSDVVRANLLAAAVPQAAGQLFNIGTGRPVSLNHLVALLADLSQVAISPVYQAPRPGDIRHSYASAEQARQVLGWSAQVPLAEGLKRLIQTVLAI
jgi:UDP-glucose 4-epimerase